MPNNSNPVGFGRNSVAPVRYERSINAAINQLDARLAILETKMSGSGGSTSGAMNNPGAVLPIQSTTMTTSNRNNKKSSQVPRQKRATRIAASGDTLATARSYLVPRDAGTFADFTTSATVNSANVAIANATWVNYAQIAAFTVNSNADIVQVTLNATGASADILYHFELSTDLARAHIIIGHADTSNDDGILSQIYQNVGTALGGISNTFYFWLKQNSGGLITVTSIVTTLSDIRTT